jgi:pimeloyl-ACP methyl ester carboxylesterase
VLSGQVNGEGRPVVVLPGFGLDAAVMAAAFEPAFGAAGGWQRIYLDLPGTSGSAPVEPTSDAVLSAIEQSVADRLGDRPFALAGHSYGGYLASGLARRRPGQVRGLLLVCSGVKIDPARRDLAGVLASDPEPDWLGDVPDDLHQHFAHAVGLQTRAVATRLARAFTLIGKVDEEYLDRLRATGYQLSDEDSGQQFDGPVAVLSGRRDRVAGYRDQFEALARYPDGSYTAVPDTGHYLPFERPELFAALARDWLARSAEG